MIARGTISKRVGSDDGSNSERIDEALWSSLLGRAI